MTHTNCNALSIVIVTALVLTSCHQTPTLQYVGVKLINDQCITTWADDRGELYYEGNQPILSNGKKECAGG